MLSNTAVNFGRYKNMYSEEINSWYLYLRVSLSALFVIYLVITASVFIISGVQEFDVFKIHLEL